MTNPDRVCPVCGDTGVDPRPYHVGDHVYKNLRCPECKYSNKQKEAMRVFTTPAPEVRRIQRPKCGEYSNTAKDIDVRRLAADLEQARWERDVASGKNQALIRAHHGQVKRAEKAEAERDDYKQQFEDCEASCGFALMREYEAKIDRLQGLVDAVRPLLQRIHEYEFFWSSADGYDLADAAVEGGLLERVPYDPETHGELEADPGEEVYVYTDKFHALLPPQASEK